MVYRHRGALAGGRTILPPYQEANSLSAADSTRIPRLKILGTVVLRNCKWENLIFVETWLRTTSEEFKNNSAANNCQNRKCQIEHEWQGSIESAKAVEGHGLQYK
jgi:hypothetical protein